MEPTIVEQPQLILLGFSFFGDPFAMAGGWSEENEIGRLWARFMAYLDRNRVRIRHAKPDAVMYEVHIMHQETQRTGEFEVFVGLEVTQIEGAPLDTSIKVLPAAAYAVFTLRGEQIVSDWIWLIGEWLSQAGLESDWNHSIQRYDERFKGLQRIQESVLDVYIPLKS
ncbi:MAG: GyrI-like domain-containing protein [Chloroflexota bacterium]